MSSSSAKRSSGVAHSSQALEKWTASRSLTSAPSIVSEAEGFLLRPMHAVSSCGPLRMPIIDASSRPAANKAGLILSEPFSVWDGGSGRRCISSLFCFPTRVCSSAWAEAVALIHTGSGRSPGPLMGRRKCARARHLKAFARTPQKSTCANILRALWWIRSPWV